jgi:hypothetical protein
LSERLWRYLGNLNDAAIRVVKSTRILYVRR